MRQLVHDTEYDPAELYQAGWPLRWRDGASTDVASWKSETTIDGTNVRQRYTIDGDKDSEAWLRYQHIVPTYDVWQRLEQMQFESPDQAPVFTVTEQGQWPRRLITDANPYNARQGFYRAGDMGSLKIEAEKLGLHWVGDLIVEADVEVESATGELLLDLVEGGKHFRCTIDLANGQARLSADGAADFAPTAQTSIDGPGEYRVAFANVDDQLLLWIDGDLVTFKGGTVYDVERVFGDRSEIRPKTSADDPGDLAPAGIGARNAKLAVSRLRLWRDIYYIADSWEKNQRSDFVTDFPHPFDQQLLRLPFDPSLWDRFSEREHVDFPLGDNQFFVMGDNSAESSDARLWFSRDPRSGGMPGGAYLERDLLIGKALCVYWPHSWNRIPGTPIPFPLFPNVMDMRLVR
jgi:signal peptidase I